MSNETILKSTDLRMGNMVKAKPLYEHLFPFTKGVVVVEAISRDYIQGKQYKTLTYEQIEPIPLTPEILKGAGFKKLSHFNVQDSMDISIGRNRVVSVGCIGTPNEMIFLNEEDPQEVRAVVVLRNFDYDGKTYLHQLQNIFHSLTGKELEINTKSPAMQG